MTLNEKISLIENKFSIKVKKEMLFKDYVDGLVGVSTDNRLVYDREIIKNEALNDYDLDDDEDNDSVFLEIEEMLDGEIRYLSYDSSMTKPYVMETIVAEIMGDNYHIEEFVKWWGKNNDEYTEGFFFDDYYDALVGFDEYHCYYDYEKLISSVMQNNKVDTNKAKEYVEKAIEEIDPDYRPVFFYVI